MNNKQKFEHYTLLVVGYTAGASTAYLIVWSLFIALKNTI